MNRLVYLSVITVMSGLTKTRLVIIAVAWAWMLPVVAWATDDYQRSFDSYRQAYSLFEVRRADYQKAQTFAAEEALVSAARDMLLLRSDSWFYYWKAMEHGYSLVASAEVESKQQWQQFFEDEYRWLNQHKESLAEKKVRRELVEETARLDIKYSIYLSQAYEANVETISGRMEDAIKETIKLNQALLERAGSQNIPTEQREAAVRGLESTIERLNQLYDDLVLIRKDLMDNSGFVDNQQFGSISKDFAPLHQKLVQLAMITRELSKDIQW